jgi:hypothetical protein
VAIGVLLANLKLGGCGETAFYEKVTKVKADVAAVRCCFVPDRFSFVFFAPDSCIIWPDAAAVKGARSSARSSEQSGDPLRRAHPALSKIIRGEENWATLRRRCECGPATASFLIGIIGAFRSFLC